MFHYIRLIIEACLKHHKLCGNFCKSYFLMTHAALEKSGILLGNSLIGSCKTARRQEILNMLIWFNQNILCNVHLNNFLFNQLDGITVTNVCSEVKELSHHIIKSSLIGKFSNNAVDFLTQKLSQMLWNSCNCSIQQFLDTVYSYIQHFDEIVHLASGVLLQHSTLHEGLLLNKCLPLTKFTKVCGIQQIIVTNFDDKLHPLSDIVLQSTNSYADFVFPYKYLKEWMQQCHELQVTVICFQGKALGTLASLCKEYDIILMDCLTAEEITSICSYLDIMPLTDVMETISSCVVKVEISEIQIGNQVFTNFNSVGMSNTLFVSHSLVLCSPSVGLCSQYKNSLYNSLLALQHWFYSCGFTRQNQNLKGVSVEGGGLFYIKLYKLLSNLKLVKSALTNIPWNKQDLEAYEFAFDIFSDILLAVPRILHNNSVAVKDKHSRFIHSLQNCNASESKKLKNVIEPLNCHLTLLHSVVDTVIQIVQLDIVVR